MCANTSRAHRVALDDTTMLKNLDENIPVVMVQTFDTMPSKFWAYDSSNFRHKPNWAMQMPHRHCIAELLMASHGHMLLQQSLALQAHKRQKAAKASWG